MVVLSMIEARKSRVVHREKTGRGGLKGLPPRFRHALPVMAAGAGLQENILRTVVPEAGGALSWVDTPKTYEVMTLS